MEFNIPDDAEYTHEVVVTEDLVAKGIGLKKMVLSTPSLILQMEIASHNAIRDYLPDGYTSVGTGICMKHLKPTKMGDRIRVVSKLVKRDGRKLEFDVVAYDSQGKIGEGKHYRYIVNIEEFESRIT